VKEIRLTNNLCAFVSECDYEALSIYTWYPAKTEQNTYHAIARIGGKTARMHRIIMGAEKGQIVDHIDGNPLNNTRDNLRFADKYQNGYNSKSRAGSTSKYKGVCFEKDHHGKQKWRAYINYKGKQRRLGRFYTERDAALAYNNAAKELHGEYARLNEVERKRREARENA
jgi:hypothetical protein